VAGGLGNRKNPIFVFFYLVVFETGSCHVAQAGIELMMFLPQSNECTTKPSSELFFFLISLFEFYRHHEPHFREIRK
jgi:hypothetical protein